MTERPITLKTRCPHCRGRVQRWESVPGVAECVECCAEFDITLADQIRATSGPNDFSAEAEMREERRQIGTDA